MPNEERDLAAFQQRILEDGLRNMFDRSANQSGHPTTESLATSGLETVNSSNSTNSLARRTPSSGPSIQGRSRGSLEDGVNEALQDWQELPASSSVLGVDGEFLNFWGDEGEGSVMV